MRSTAPLVLASLLALGGCATAPAGLSVQDSTALRGMLEQSQQQFVQRDFAAWSATFADSGWFMPPASPPIVGREAIASWGAGTPDMSSATFADIRLAGHGNVAYGTSDVAIQFVGLPMSEGKQLVVWERGTDGGWKVARWSFNASIQHGGGDGHPVRPVAALLLAAGALAACGPAPSPAPPTRSFWIAGTEPFWGIRIDSTGIRYSTPDDTAGVRFPPVAPTVSGDTLRWALRSERDTIDLVIWEGSCSDGMSDREWSWTAAVTIGGTSHHGCARE